MAVGAKDAAKVDTKKVTGRRELRFTSLDGVIADAERLAASEESGTLRALGNWTLGQTFGHLACWIDFALDGYPPEVRPPWFVKMLMRPMKKKLLAGKMPVGVRIPKFPEGTLGTAVLLTREGLERLRRSCTRLKAEAPQNENPIFGKLTHEEWTKMHLGHANLHLSFFVPG